MIVYPTDSGYALGCKIEDKNAMERIVVFASCRTVTTYPDVSRSF
ncbi:Sua5/YciO/YrdC/YwlC family protein [Escherichia coli]